MPGESEKYKGWEKPPVSIQVQELAFWPSTVPQ